MTLIIPTTSEFSRSPSLAYDSAVLDPALLHDRKTCTCTRCTGFLPGNKLSAGANHRGGMPAIHGSFKSPLRLRPEAEEIAKQIRPLLLLPHPSFEGTLQSYCITLARIQRAYNALEECEEQMAEDPEFVPAFNHISLGDYLMRWQASARKDAQALGLTPESAAKILKDAELGSLAARTGVTQQTVSQASDSALEQARRLLLAGEDVIDV